MSEYPKRVEVEQITVDDGRFATVLYRLILDETIGTLGDQQEIKIPKGGLLAPDNNFQYMEGRRGWIGKAGEDLVLMELTWIAPV